MSCQSNLSRRYAAIGAALFISGLAVICRLGLLDATPKRVERQAQKEQTTMNTEAQHLQIRQSTVGHLGNYRIGVMAVEPIASGDGLRARLAITPVGVAQAQRNDYETRTWVQSGDLLPIGSSFYRVVEITAPKRGIFDWRPGGSTESVIMDRDPLRFADAPLLDEAMTLLVGGSGELNGREFAVEAIERRPSGAGAGPSARLAIWSNDLDKDRAEKAGKITRVEVSVGSLVTLGPSQHRLLSCLEAMPAQHRPGFLQIAYRAQPSMVE